MTTESNTFLGKLVRGEQKTSVGWKLVGKE